MNLSEIWVDTTREELAQGLGVRRKATAVETYEWVTRMMLDARVAHKADPDSPEAERVDESFGDQLDRLDWYALTEAEQAKINSIIQDYHVAHDPEEVYLDEWGVKRWKFSGDILECLWEVP